MRALLSKVCAPHLKALEELTIGLSNHATDDPAGLLRQFIRLFA